MEAHTPLLENMSSSLGLDSTEPVSPETPLLRERKHLALSNYETKTSNKCGRKLPHIIAHRGFKNKFPENTMGAFRGAIDAGSHAIETDLHLSKDGVVVISHDATLKRCFGVDKRVIDCDWEYLSTLRTLEKPYDSMPRLSDLLEYLASPGLEDIWLLLDIKIDNDPETIMRRIAETAAAVAPGRKPWSERIVLGCWSAKYLPLAREYLPDYPIALICIDLSYARQFLSIPNVSFNVNQKILMGPLGRNFLEEARAANRLVFVWTVNKTSLMRWSIRKGVDGVITDDPAVFKAICDNWDGGGTDKDPITMSDRLESLLVSAVVLLFGWLFKLKYFPPVEKFVPRETNGKDKKLYL
ncbi:hypothetical protein DTO027B9_5099 [Paecilomyces variotii]|nr:hypothetical protein DTO027B9_5099 [Paecilomyces variotii]